MFFPVIDEYVPPDKSVIATVADPSGFVPPHDGFHVVFPVLIAWHTSPYVIAPPTPVPAAGVWKTTYVGDTEPST